MKDVEGKVAFITGGASGVGLGMAKVFAQAGMKVVVADIRQDHLDQAMAHFSDTNFQVHPIRLDVADRAALPAPPTRASGCSARSTSSATMPASTCSRRWMNPPMTTGTGSWASISAA